MTTRLATNGRTASTAVRRRNSRPRDALHSSSCSLSSDNSNGEGPVVPPKDDSLQRGVFLSFVFMTCGSRSDGLKTHGPAKPSSPVDLDQAMTAKWLASLRIDGHQCRRRRYAKIEWSRPWRPWAIDQGMKTFRYCIARHAALSLGMALCGCTTLLPTSKHEIASAWGSYDDAVKGLSAIEPYRATRDDVHGQGLDPHMNPAITVLHFGDVLQRFSAAALIKPETSIVASATACMPGSSAVPMQSRSGRSFVITSAASGPIRSTSGAMS